jgi:hypothetical protein
MKKRTYPAKKRQARWLWNVFLGKISRDLNRNLHDGISHLFSPFVEVADSPNLIHVWEEWEKESWHHVYASIHLFMHCS